MTCHVSAGRFSHPTPVCWLSMASSGERWQQIVFLPFKSGISIKIKASYRLK